MSAFDVAISRVLLAEGGYVNDPHDPGGETQWGISKRSYPTVDIRALTRAGAIEIYRRDFWARIHADDLPEDLRFQALDFAVNAGIETSIRKLQSAAGVADDGHWGPFTTTAVQKANKYALAARFLARVARYRAALSKFPIYGKGWTNRLADDLDYLADDFETPDGATA